MLFLQRRAYIDGLHVTAGILRALIILDALKAMKNAKHLRANGTKKGH